MLLVSRKSLQAREFTMGSELRQWLAHGTNPLLPVKPLTT